VLAAVTVVLAGFLVYQIHGDVLYALSPARPVDLGEARALLGEARALARAPAAALPGNRYVRIAGAADRESALILDTHGSWSFTQFFRLLGTGSKLFVRRAPDPLPVDLAERDVFTGRLQRFRDLSFAASIGRHFANQVSATHFFSPEALEGALAAGTGAVTLPDLLGETVTLASEDELAIDVTLAGSVRLELPGERFPDAASARAAVAERGGEVLSAAPAADKSGRQVVVARFPPARRDAALAALGDIDRRVHIAPARTTTRVRVGDLRPSPGGKGLVAHPRPSGTSPQPDVTTVLERADIQSVRTVAPVRIPDDAWLLVEGDRPRDHLQILVVALLLVGFAAVNLLAVRRAA
jgi:hypothetical protein